MNRIVFTIILLILSLTGCSEASKETLVHGTDLSASIRIKDYSNLGNLNQVTVKLFDREDQPIFNKNIVLSVNGKPLKPQNQNGNYYNTTYWYEADNIPADRIYYLNIQLEDSTNYELAAYIPFKEIAASKTSITKDEKGYTIAWHSLNNYNTIHVRKSIFNSKTNTHSDSLISKEIDPIKGRFHVDSEFFRSDSITTVKEISIGFIGSKGGLLNPKLLKNSSIEGFSSFSIDTKEIR
jgi:hypothetical protein